VILVLPDAIRNQMSVHASTVHPSECCGFLLGRNADGVLTASEVFPVRNLSARPDRYEMAPEAVLNVDHRARARKLEVLGAYHSHSGVDALPSEIDRREAFPGMLHIVLSTLKNDMRAWLRSENGDFTPVPIMSNPHE